MLSHYLTYHSTIDDLHCELFSLLNSLNETSSPAEIAKLLGLFKEHFAIEVALMHEANYPYVSYHTEDHNKEIQRLQTICSTYLSKFAIQEFIQNFKHHIDWHDQQFTKWLKEQDPH